MQLSSVSNVFAHSEGSVEQLLSPLCNGGPGGWPSQPQQGAAC